MSSGNKLAQALGAEAKGMTDAAKKKATNASLFVTSDFYCPKYDKKFDHNGVILDSLDYANNN